MAKEVFQTYDAREIAEMLEVHRYTVYKLIADGRIHAFKVSNKYRVTAEELRRFVTDYVVEDEAEEDE